MRGKPTIALALATAAGVLGAGSAIAAPASTFLGGLGAAHQVGSTVPGNGDVNPYGVAVVHQSMGDLVKNRVLVSNFNAKSNVQGTGTTIVQIAPNGTETQFARIDRLPAADKCPGGIGLTTALEILPGGYVVVGSLPTSHGDLPKNNPAGCLIVLNDRGHVAETISNIAIDGPWDMTATSSAGHAALYVSNALGGNTKVSASGVPLAGQCTVSRIDLTLSPSHAPRVMRSTIIGTNFPWKADAAALVLAPTGLAVSHGTLYVDDSLTNSVSAITSAATRTTPVSAAVGMLAKGHSLNAPLGMIATPNGDLLIVNGDNGVATELSPAGAFRTTRTLVNNGAGDLFGLSLTPNRQGIYFVNDATNALDVATLK